MSPLMGKCMQQHHLNCSECENEICQRSVNVGSMFPKSEPNWGSMGHYWKKLGSKDTPPSNTQYSRDLPPRLFELHSHFLLHRKFMLFILFIIIWKGLTNRGKTQWSCGPKTNGELGSKAAHVTVTLSALSPQNMAGREIWVKQETHSHTPHAVSWHGNKDQAQIKKTKHTQQSLTVTCWQINL